MAKTKGEIVIIEENCLGCGYCELFCPTGGIVITGDKFSPMGFLLPTFLGVDQCTACGNCRAQCPHFAIEVYKHVKAGG